MRKFPLAFMALCLFMSAFSQKNSSYKFTKVTIADLEKKKYSVDSQAHAVYLADVGASNIIPNMKGGFNVEFKRRVKIHILDKNGYDEASFIIPLFGMGSSMEKLSDLKAYTYTLENGAIKETKLAKENIFLEKYSKSVTLKKFTLPNVREGSIVDVEYTIESEFLTQLQPWSFQGDVPRLWTEYRVAMPEFLDYVFITQGFTGYHITDRQDRNEKFTVINSGTHSTDKFEFTSRVTDYRWVMKDVPAMKEESFTSTIENHVAKIEFQLSALKEPYTYKTMMSTWPELSRELLDSEDFGLNFTKSNNWLDDEMSAVVAGSSNQVEKAQRIFQYVRDNFTAIPAGHIYASQSLRNLVKTKKGNVSDINLLLTAMLRNAGIHAEPVILSTREHGYTFPLYPIVDKFNYTIASATIDNRKYFLDASQPRLGFGRLLPHAFNGHARIVNEQATPLQLSADSVREKKITHLMLNTNEKGEWLGAVTQSLGYFESYKVRGDVHRSGKDDYFKNIRKNFGSEITMEEPVIDSLQRYDDPVAVKYKFKMEMNNEDIIYLSPLFREGYNENPFKSAVRSYPVEMPYTIDETYIATIQVPENYIVDELPKSMKVKLNQEEEGMFDYLISQSGGTISMRSRVMLKRANFAPEEYEMLREFFNMIVNKQQEQIVLKKKK